MLEELDYLRNKLNYAIKLRSHKSGNGNISDCALIDKGHK